MNEQQQTSSIKVAARIRPLTKKDLDRGVKIGTTVNEHEKQLTIGGKTTFTFDHVFDSNASQSSIYDSCVNNLVEGIFDGYNATVLAYGQTGSGKTHTMGTGMDSTGDIPHQDLGIVPRAVQEIFEGIESRKQYAEANGILPPVFEVNVTYVELYNENILDLLNTNKSSQKISICEDPGTKEILLSDVKTNTVACSKDVMETLRLGAVNRTVGATKMNEKSSRSHAIFSVYLKQKRCSVNATGDFDEFLTAKFHFVDLAGSERIAKTGASGTRAKEGCKINQSLLTLGNVIRALAEKKQVNYRDSKLTRLLKDSLGGNSKTLMIACASSSECDVDETRTTMQYASKTKNIQNTVTINQDKSTRLVEELRQHIAKLKSELCQFKSETKVITQDVAVSTDADSLVAALLVTNDSLELENAQLLGKLKALQEVLDGRSDLKTPCNVNRRKPLANLKAVFRGIPVKAVLEGLSKKFVSNFASLINKL